MFGVAVFCFDDGTVNKPVFGRCAFAAENQS
jgi:hypothetical protein